MKKSLLMLVLINALILGAFLVHETSATKKTLNERVRILERKVTNQRSDINTLQSQLDAINAVMTVTSDSVTFSGVNVNIQNGSGSTGSVNGYGNLILGYNENAPSRSRTGSHNLILGTDHGYTSYGGIVSGYNNQLNGVYSTILGGWSNTTSNDGVIAASVQSSTTGTYGLVAGGQNNTSKDLLSVVLGGDGQSSAGDFTVTHP